MLKPVNPEKRYACPFYGFYSGMLGSVLLDQGGNQCALILDRYAPCSMETRNQTPCWSQCPIRAEHEREGSLELLEQLLERAQIFPAEFRPEGQVQWEGIKATEWRDYVMSDECPRPESE